MAELGILVSRAGLPEPAAAEYSCAGAWAALTAAHARVSGLLADALAGECGLTINEFEVLLRLDHAGAAGVRQSDLLSAVPVSQPALSRALSRMSARHLVTREAAPDDGRGVLIAPTPDGQALLRAAIPVHARTVRTALLERLTGPEQELLASVLRRVAAG